MWNWYWAIAVLMTLIGGEPNFVMFFIYYGVLVFIAQKILRLMSMVRDDDSRIGEGKKHAQ